MQIMLLKSFLSKFIQKYQENSKTSLKGSDFFI